MDVTTGSDNFETLQVQCPMIFQSPVLFTQRFSRHVAPVAKLHFPCCGIWTAKLNSSGVAIIVQLDDSDFNQTVVFLFNKWITLKGPDCQHCTQCSPRLVHPIAKTARLYCTQRFFGPANPSLIGGNVSQIRAVDTQSVQLSCQEPSNPMNSLYIWHVRLILEIISKF